MRVLYVNHTSRISGGERSLIALLGALPDSVQATAACPEGPLARRLRRDGIDVFPIRGTDGSLRLHPAHTPRAALEMAVAAMQVRRAATRLRASLVHANSIRAGMVAVAASSRPTIVHVRDCLPEGVAPRIALRAIDRADALIANSAHTRSTIGPGANRAHVVHSAVDLARFRKVLSRGEARTRLGLPSDGAPVLAVIGQITPWKGQDDAIRVARDLIRAHPRLQLLLVGSPKFDSAATRYDNAAFLESLRRLVAELGIEESVRFLGERDDVPEVLAALDLLLAPSWEEPFGRTIVEAMAAGVPVAATNVGGPPEIVGGSSCGLLLPPRQPATWAAGIGGLLADPARLAEMGGRGRDAARRFDVERHATGVLEIYESVLDDACASG